MTFGLGNRCSIQLSYGTGLFRLARGCASRERRFPRVLRGALLAAALAAGPPLHASEVVPADCTSGATAISGIVAAVADGASFRFADGREVHLASLLPPGPMDRAESETAASRAALEMQVLGRELTIHAEPKPDRYGRLVARAAVAAGRWVEAALVSAGRARALPAAEACAGPLLRLETAARAARTGLWASEAFRPFDAGDLPALTAAIGRYAVVEGVIRRTGGSRARIYLDFGRRYREDFSIIVPRAIAAALEKKGASLRNWRGRRVRVRGMLLAWGGPAIELSSAAAIELLDKSEP